MRKVVLSLKKVWTVPAQFEKIVGHAQEHQNYD